MVDSPQNTKPVTQFQNGQFDKTPSQSERKGNFSQKPVSELPPVPLSTDPYTQTSTRTAALLPAHELQNRGTQETLPPQFHQIDVTGHEPQEQVRAMFAEKGIYYNGDASWVKRADGSGYWHIHDGQVQARETGTQLNMRADAITSDSGVHTVHKAETVAASHLPAQREKEAQDQTIKDLDRVNRLTSLWTGPMGIAARGLGALTTNVILGKQDAGEAVDKAFVSNIPVVGTIVNLREGIDASKQSWDVAQNASQHGNTGDAVRGYYDFGMDALETATTTAADVVTFGLAPNAPHLHSSAGVAPHLGEAFEHQKPIRSASEAATIAHEAGLINSEKGQLGFGSHSTSRSVRAVEGVTGATHQSAHLVPQAVYRALGESPNSALTIADMPRNTHRTLDFGDPRLGVEGWVNKWNDAKARGDQITAGDVHSWVSTSIQQMPESMLPQATKNTLEWRLHTELYNELGLKPDDVIIARK